MNVQHWPAEGQFLNKEIPHFGWMEMLFGACRDGPGNALHAEAVKRAISKAKSGGSSKAVVDENSDDASCLQHEHVAEGSEVVDSN